MVLDRIARSFPFALVCGSLAAQFPTGDELLAAPHLRVPQTGLAAHSVLDADGDGFLDVVFFHQGNAHDGVSAELGLAFGNGDGTLRGTIVQFPYAPPASSPYPSVYPLHVLELDGDGRDDVVYYSSILSLDARRRPKVLGGVGSPFLSSSSGTLPVPYGTFVRNISSLDVDQDGVLDVLLESYSGPFGPGGADRMVALGDGMDGWTPVPGSALPSGDGGFGLVAADLDGDGTIDALANESVHSHVGAGTFAPTTGPFSNFAGDERHLADFDQDGDLDVLVVGGGFDRWFRNDGLASFALEAGAIPQVESVTAALRDLDGDGALDYVGREGRLSNDGAGAFTLTPDPWSNPNAYGDFDGDGDLDRVGQANSIGFARDDGTYGTRELGRDLLPGIPVYSHLRSVVAGDLNGDGTIDLGIGLESFSSQETLVFRNDGTGRFVVVADPGMAGARVVEDVLADFDLDGDPDLLVLTSIVGTEITLARNDGSASFSVEPVGIADGVVSLALLDKDLDGDVDVFVGKAGANRLLLNDGTGTFASVPQPGIQTPQSPRVGVGDLDGDGELDLVHHSRVGIDCEVHFNDGGVVWKLAHRFRIEGNARQADLVHLDGDGHLDLVLAGSHYLGLLNDGTGRFREDGPASLRWNGYGIGSVSTCDLDGDGIVELVRRPRDSTFASWVVVRGTPSGPELTEQPFTGLGRSTGVVEFADFDGDGDVDALALGAVQGILRNLGTDLSWRRIPSVGKALELELRGPAGEPWLLAAALDTELHELGPLGNAWLAPSSLVVARVGSFGALGRADFRSTVPPSPSLVGLVLHWQALVGSSPRFTNLESTTFADF